MPVYFHSIDAAPELRYPLFQLREKHSTVPVQPITSQSSEQGHEAQNQTRRLCWRPRLWHPVDLHRPLGRRWHVKSKELMRASAYPSYAFLRPWNDLGLLVMLAGFAICVFAQAVLFFSTADEPS